MPLEVRHSVHWGAPGVHLMVHPWLAQPRTEDPEWCAGPNQWYPRQHANSIMVARIYTYTHERGRHKYALEVAIQWGQRRNVDSAQRKVRVGFPRDWYGDNSRGVWRHCFTGKQLMHGLRTVASLRPWPTDPDLSELWRLMGVLGARLDALAERDRLRALEAAEQAAQAL